MSIPHSEDACEKCKSPFKTRCYIGYQKELHRNSTGKKAMKKGHRLQSKSGGSFASDNKRYVKFGAKTSKQASLRGVRSEKVKGFAGVT